ncbi:MAG: glycosyl transferase, partial [Alphaproteobacteria bacterium]|nr:glycosyl transferase [Alphaproteobacteria bacterium]
MSAAAWLAAWLLLLALSLATELNHDEDQYLAAAMLIKNARPFVDFLYLQTPLQLPLAGLLFGMIDGWNLVVFRFATATLAVATLWLVRRTALAAGAAERQATISALLMACCQTFLFSGSVFRNDMLPAFLATGALYAAVTALRSGKSVAVLWLIAGIGMGAAASTKISYALPAAAAGAFLMARSIRTWPKRETVDDVVSYAIGASVGLAPSVIAWLRAPEAFE